MSRSRRFAFAGAVCAVAAMSACERQIFPPRAPRPTFAAVAFSFQCKAAAKQPAVDERAADARDERDRGAPNPFAFDDLAARWRAEGAFATGQPIVRSGVPAGDVRLSWSSREKSLPGLDRLVPIGGDYWQGTEYPLARPGAAWVSSAFAQGAGGTAARGDDALLGTLTSTAPFVLDPATRYLHYSIGGSRDDRARLELQVRLRGATQDEKQADLRQLAACDELGFTGARASAVVDDFATVLVRTGNGQEPMVPHVASLVRCAHLLGGREARVRVVDESERAHVNVADVFFSSRAALPRGPAVWGLGDFHTHPTAHVAFGGLQGLHPLWGAPGRGIDDYFGSDGARRLARDIPACDAHQDDAGRPVDDWNGHHGGLAAPTMIDVTEYRTSTETDDVDNAAIAARHGHRGPPGYEDFPDFRSGAHQQYHVTHIYRAYLGGLRLMSSLAVHNPGLEYGMGWLTCGKDGRAHARTTPDLAVVEAHVEVMRELAARNSDWMEIAYTPSEAREIIGKNKLAVVLGIEVPQLGRPEDGAVADQIERLARLGIRQVTPIHALDNALGGPAVFVDLYNSVNDWVNRPAETRDEVVEVSGLFVNQPFGPHAFFEVAEPPAASEPVLFRLESPPRIVISDAFPRPGFCHVPLFGVAATGCLHPFVNTAPAITTKNQLYGTSKTAHVNALGLTDRGREYVARLMGRGMLVDLAHMSDRSRAQTFDRAKALPGCGEYPFMFSHAGFRKLPFRKDYSDRVEKLVDETKKRLGEPLKKGPVDMGPCVRDHARCDPEVLRAAVAAKGSDTEPGTVDRGLLPKEFDVPTADVDRVARSGGAVGLFAGQDPVDARRFDEIDLYRKTKLPVVDDCAGSSKSFASALWFGMAHHPNDGLGIATDFVMHMTVAPRFGDRACALYLKAGQGSRSAAQLLETLVNPGEYAFAAQRNGVAYRGVSSPNVPVTGAPLEPSKMGTRTFDFNTDGLAHYGMLPDMLQDVKNVGVGELGPLFRSAQGYIDMWERAWQLAGCDEDPAACNPARAPLLADAACGDTCPNSWNAGAPLQSLGELEREECPVNEDVRIADATLKFAPSKDTANLLRRQGDWAVFELPARTSWSWWCGQTRRDLRCPKATRYVKVRRVFESRLAANLVCDEPPDYPMGGNRRVVFQCLAAPPIVDGP